MSTPRDFDNLPDAARISIPELARIFGRTSGTIWNWSRTGKLPKPTPLVDGAAPDFRLGDLRAVLGPDLSGSATSDGSESRARNLAQARAAQRRRDPASAGP
jgi:hypothetical protein